MLGVQRARSERALSHQACRVMLLLLCGIQGPGHNPQLGALIVRFHLDRLVGQDVPARRGWGWGRGLVCGRLVGRGRVAGQSDGLAGMQAVVHGVAEVCGGGRVMEGACGPFNSHLKKTRCSSVTTPAHRCPKDDPFPALRMTHSLL